eukprot:210837-Amphidinium_carterae.1
MDNHEEQAASGSPPRQSAAPHHQGDSCKPCLPCKAGLIVGAVSVTARDVDLGYLGLCPTLGTLYSDLV